MSLAVLPGRRALPSQAFSKRVRNVARRRRSEENQTMTIKPTPQLRNLETMKKRIEAFEPTNEIEVETKQILLTLLKSRRDELRKELVINHIRQKYRVAS